MIILFVVGAMFAFLVGIGTGGGMLLMPVLIEYFGYSVTEARSIVLLLYIPISLIVSYINIKNGYFQLKFSTFAVMSVAGTVGVACGNYLSGLLDAESIKKAYAIFIIVAGAYQLIQLYIANKSKVNQ